MFRLENTPALSNFLVAAACLLEYAGLLPSFSGELMAIQFIVIHSSAFVMAIPYLEIPEKWKPRALYALLCLYALFAIQAGGLSGVFQFAGLTFATYSGYVLRGDTASRMPLISRWALGFAVFIFALSVCGVSGDVEDWDGNRRVAFAGAIYFSLAGLMERAGLHESGWKKALRWLAARDPEFKAHMPGWMAKVLSETPPPKD